MIHFYAKCSVDRWLAGLELFDGSDDHFSGKGRYVHGAFHIPRKEGVHVAYLEAWVVTLSETSQPSVRQSRVQTVFNFSPYVDESAMRRRIGVTLVVGTQYPSHKCYHINAFTLIHPATPIFITPFSHPLGNEGKRQHASEGALLHSPIAVSQGHSAPPRYAYMRNTRVPRCW